MNAPTLAAGGAVRICALLTTFNRRELTLACLGALQASAAKAGVSLAAVIVDDASRDGTADAVLAEFAWVRVIGGSGKLFWCRGMHRAFAEALAVGYDHYLWLNDDTTLAPEAIAILLDSQASLAARRGSPVLVVGSTVDPGTREHSYGGELRPSRFRPLRVCPLPPRAEPQPCDSMTGNIVLISAAAASRVGNLDPAFEHAMGDTDYALRARAAGVEVWVAAGVLGTCRSNDLAETYRDASLPLALRWRRMLGPKGLPWRSWLHFVRRHGGVLWPLLFVWPYLRLIADARPARDTAAARQR